MKKAIKLNLIGVVLVGALGLYACQSVSKSKRNDLPDEFTIRSSDWKGEGEVDLIAATAHVKRLKDNLYSVAYAVDPDAWNGRDEIFGQAFGYNKSNFSYFFMCVNAYLVYDPEDSFFLLGRYKNEQDTFNMTGAGRGVLLALSSPKMPNLNDLDKEIEFDNKTERLTTEEYDFCRGVFKRYPVLQNQP